MKSICFLFCFVAITEFAYSQRNFFTMPAGVCIPQSDFKAIANVGFHLGAGYERALTDKFRATIVLGNLYFGKKSVTAPTVPPSTVTFKSNMWLLQAGAKYFLSLHPSRKFFIFGESGIHMLTGYIKVNGSDATPPDEVHFSYAAGGGYAFGKFELAYKQQWIDADDGTLRYGDVRIVYIIPYERQKATK